MTSYALRWTITGAYVQERGVPVLFATEAEARDYYRKYYSYLDSGNYSAPGGVPEVVRVELREAA